MKTFFNLEGQYSGLKVRRLAKSGRLVLYRVLNDGAPYWLVQIRNFDERTDRPRIRHESKFVTEPFAAFLWGKPKGCTARCCQIILKIALAKLLSNFGHGVTA